MGSSQSIPSTSEIKDAPRTNEEHSTSTKNGQKNLNETTGVASAEEPTLISTDEENSSDADSSDDDSDDDDEEELDEGILERRMILEEARNLRMIAEFYHCPEKPVAVDGTACARCFFSRYSAPEQVSSEEEEERNRALADAANLKKLAVDYLQPERPVVCDGFATGRNFFTRPSAPQYEDEEELIEHERIMEDIQQLKTTAEWFLHPEKPVSVDATACGRNYFTRASAPEYEDEDSMDERDQVLSDAAELKKVADWYLHPEKPVEVDATACGRNYFTRASAPEYEDEGERAQVLADAKKLKQVAEWYHCPEKQVVSDAFASGRNYFSRPSAPVPDADMEEADRILADAMALKEVAEWYYCPEKPVEVDPAACARNYFSRPSAPQYEDVNDMEERKLVLAEAGKLKEVAEWYHHPETPITSSIAVTRNFFTRPSAEGLESPEDEEEKARVLADAMQLKKLAVDFLYPEKPVVSNGNCVRSYFDRPSAPGHLDYIHTQGHAVGQEQYLEDEHIAHHDFYHHHEYDYGHHHDDDHSHHTQSDHFEMDEDVYHEFRESMVSAQQQMQQVIPAIKEVEGDEKEGNLSRSPSCVMLFDEAAM